MELKPGYKQTEVGVIPEDWEICPIGDLVEGFRGGAPFKPSDFTDSGVSVLPKGGVIRGGILDINENDKQFCSRSFADTHLNNQVDSAYTIVVLRDLVPSGPSIGLMVKIPTSEIYVLAQGVYGFKVNKQVVAGYLIQLSNTSFYRKLMNSIMVGSTQVHITNTSFKLARIPLPPTKAEQTAIANALSDADALIQSLTRLIAKKRQIKQGAMQTLLNPYENGRLKAGWVVKKLGDTAILKARIGWQGLTTVEYRKTGDYFLITGTEFRNGFIDWESCFYVDFLRYKQDRNIQIKENDVLVTKDGTIGKVAFIKRLPKPATLNSGVFVIRSNDESFHPEFFYYVLLSDIFDRFLSQLSAGSTINHLYQKDFVNFEFYAPKDTKEQTRIATILSDMDAEIATLEAKLAKYGHIKQGMMQNLLTGRIRLI